MNTLICELASLWFLGIIFRLTVFYRYIQIEGRGLANVFFYFFICSPIPPPAKRIKVTGEIPKKCTVPHVLQGELARLCNRFQVRSGVSSGAVQSNTLLECSISKKIILRFNCFEILIFLPLNSQHMIANSPL